MAEFDFNVKAKATPEILNRLLAKLKPGEQRHFPKYDITLRKKKHKVGIDKKGDKRVPAKGITHSKFKKRYP